jgi:hypothetical protein
LVNKGNELLQQSFHNIIIEPFVSYEFPSVSAAIGDLVDNAIYDRETPKEKLVNIGCTENLIRR